MGSSPRGLLAYGYDIGGGGGGWTIAEVGEFGDLRVDWYDNDGDTSFTTACEDRLLASVGFTETDWKADGYFERQSAAEDQIGVEFKSKGGGEPSWMLVMAVKSAEWDECEPIDPQALINDPVAGDWDAKLANAIRVLGITPEQDKPGWFLTSHYS